ncbi:MAG TPA: hypothetical protein VD794_11545 [Flavisolibacter sp.]|nr:hypothetical protein [Flavisolibacter sp.]
MKKILILASLLCSMSFIAAAQEEQEEGNDEKGFKKEKVFVGGNFGLTFGDYTLINISPQVGYRFSRMFAVGVGINGQYVGYKDRTFNGDVYRKVSQGVTGLNLFGRVFPISNFDLFLQAQPEANYLFGKEIYYQPSKEEYKLDATIAPSFLLGGGIILGSGGRGGAMISIMYDVLQHEDSPYANKPIYNFGFVVGL